MILLPKRFWKNYLCLLVKSSKYLVFLTLLISSAYTSIAQFYRAENFGFAVGAAVSVGNKVQRIGLNFNAYYFYDFVQVNAEVRLYHHIKNLGPSMEHSEAVVCGGLVLSAGKKQDFHNPFLSVYSNQTKRVYSIAYAYDAYFNKIKTKQQTGIIALQFDAVSIITENDLYAHPTLDRFRTGAFLIQYQYQNKFQAGLNCTMWTGQMGNSVRDDKSFPYVGYMDTIGGVYPNYSHGLLSTQFKVNIGYAQNIQANLGIDAEQVRNYVQNRLIHDMIFLPRKWRNTINCHIPMIDSNGVQFLYKDGQKIRKPSLFWGIASNASAFY